MATIDQPNLAYLDLSHNQFSGKVFRNLPSNLIYFDGSDNLFWDNEVQHTDICQNDPLQIPDQSGVIFRFKFLTTILLDNNQIGGYVLQLFSKER